MAHWRFERDARFESEDPDVWLSAEKQAELRALVGRARAGDEDAIRALAHEGGGTLYYRITLGDRVPMGFEEKAVYEVAWHRRCETLRAWAKVRGISYPEAEARFRPEDPQP